MLLLSLFRSLIYFIELWSTDLFSFVVCCPISNHVMTPLIVLLLCFKFIYIYALKSFLINSIKNQFSFEGIQHHMI